MVLLPLIGSWFTRDLERERERELAPPTRELRTLRALSVADRGVRRGAFSPEASDRSPPRRRPEVPGEPFSISSSIPASLWKV